MSLPETTPAPWFALTVKPRHEKQAAQHLRMRGLEEFLPLYKDRRRWSDRVQTVELPLFPGYLFCRFAPRQWLQAVSAPGVMAVVSFGKLPQPVPETEIAAIRAMQDSGLPLQPWDYIHAGDPVEITAGALAGLSGIAVREKNIDRLVVNVQLLHRAVAVEIDRAILQPLPSHRQVAA
jgi:transcriptional antiterminator NusG